MLILTNIMSMIDDEDDDDEDEGKPELERPSTPEEREP